VRAGSNEVLTYSFVHGDILENVGHRTENSYKLINSISPDLQYYRQGLTPSLLSVVNANIRKGYDCFALFEINKAHMKNDGLNNEGVPIESDMIAAIFANKNTLSGAAYYQAKCIFNYMIQNSADRFEFKAMDSEIDNPICSPFEYRHSAMILDRKTGLFIGIVGEYKKTVMRYFKLPEYSAGFEINARALFEVWSEMQSSYSPISKYPGSERDICFKVSNTINYDQVYNAALAALGSIDVESDIQAVDIYHADNSDTKNITIKIKLVSHQKTMTGAEVNSIILSVAESVKSATGAEVI
jgi:phenylalanyl-tRNA synthetase beta chain